MSNLNNGIYFRNTVRSEGFAHSGGVERKKLYEGEAQRT